MPGVRTNELEFVDFDDHDHLGTVQMTLRAVSVSRASFADVPGLTHLWRQEPPNWLEGASDLEAPPWDVDFEGTSTMDHDPGYEEYDPGPGYEEYD